MEEKKKVNSGIDYKNKKWRPGVFIDKNKQESIEKWIADHEYKSFNEYVISLIDNDMGVDGSGC